MNRLEALPATPQRPGDPMPPSNNRLRATRGALAVAALAVLAACQTTAPPGGPGNVSRLPPGNAQRDGPEAKPPPDLDKVPDAVPQIEPIRNGGPNKPYEIAGKTYVPVTDDRALTEKGLASWYGKKFHGRRTASGEAYNMYAMTAAHKTLPIPSYARVRNPANGREVIVRVNDRGPFSPGRIIDLSYTAALKLGVLNGVAPVEISRITEDDIRTGAAMRKGPTLAGDAPPAKEAPVAMTVGELDRPANARAPDARNGAASRARAVGKTALPSVVTLAPAAGDVLATTVAPAPTAVDKSVLAGVQSPAATSTNADLGAAAVDDAASAASGSVTTVSTTTTATLKPSAEDAAASAAPAPARAEPRDERARADTTAGVGWWLQLGAYKQRDGALDFQRRLIDEQPWLAPLLAVFSDRGLNKLQAGPYTSRDDAKGAAERIRSALQLVPTIVEKR